MSENISLAVLISGNGSNLQAIIDNIKSKNLKAEIKIVISNNKDAFGLSRASANGIRKVFIDHKDYDDREIYDAELIKNIQKENVDLIILAGFMRILSSKFIKAFPNKIINIHPSLLPKYPGLNTHKKVIENKDEVHGVTVHFVDEGLDSGSIIGFIKLKVSSNEKENELENRIHKLEHYIYPKIISEFQEDKIRVEDNKVMIDKVFYENGKEYFN